MSTFRELLSHSAWLRPMALRLLRLLERDITIRNPWTGDKLKLALCRHKTYWYHGAGRERQTMETFRRLIRPGDTVIDVGGHIGYITQYFSKLVGSSGQVIVFEPGLNNLRYIQANVLDLPNVILERVAVSSSDGTAVLYEDNISGQNNSLSPDYRYLDHAAASHGVRVERIPHVVPTVTLDSYITSHRIKPDFVKIDVEGLELEVLRGASKTLREVRSLVVEITENKGEVLAILRNVGFALENQTSFNTVAVRQPESISG